MSDPRLRLGEFDLAALEAEVRHAIDHHEPERLDIVGQGEFSLALRWGDDGERVVKRIPPFRSRAAADGYTALVREYLDVLTRRGVRCVATEPFTLERDDGTAVVYLSQPCLDPDRLVDHVLAAAEPADAHPVIDELVDLIASVPHDQVGLDGQVSNWYWFDDELWHLDFSTPILLTPDHDVRFDASGFWREYPAILRPLVQRELMKIAPQFLDRTFVMKDAAANLVRQDLDAWIPAMITAAAERTECGFTEAEARAAYDADAKIYPFLQRLKRWQRTWIQRTGRRFDTLLPVEANY